MKIVTWNINGIRTAPQPLKPLLDSFDADVICLQETKITRDLLDERIALVEGYSAYFSYSRKRSGYSGVVNFCRDNVRPVAAEEGLSGYLSSLGGTKREDVVGCYGSLSDLPVKELQDLDGEGRAVITEHAFREQNGTEKTVCVINVYCPRADKQRDDRKAYKLTFCQSLQVRAEALQAAGKHVVIVGDLNTSHRPIDTCDSSGPDWPLNPLRLWLVDLLYSPLDNSEVDPTLSLQRFVDTYRFLHTDTKHAYTCWSTCTGARSNNYGCRIDYILVDYSLVKTALRSCDILPEVWGSDHCPVVAVLDLEVTASEKSPSLCTKSMPGFFGKQQKLHAFFQKKPEENATKSNAVEGGVKRTAEAMEVRIPVFPGQHPQAKRLCINSAPAVTIAKCKAKPGAKGKATAATGKSNVVNGQKSLMDFFTKKAPEAKTSTAASEPSSKQCFPEIVVPDTQLSEESASMQSGSECDEFASATQQSSFIETSIASRLEEKSSVVNMPSAANDQDTASMWKNILRGPMPAPLCHCRIKCMMKLLTNRDRIVVASSTCVLSQKGIRAILMLGVVFSNGQMERGTLGRKKKKS